ncbi:DUF6538 domain-containing protein [Roseomonas elaeocarpi]|uniref:DUF6538 domain-containing protein n=1 Tax=Roseomonas elaeocarpi TaxID=907779 RepID=A0ABV6JPR5_9PROT
MSLSSSSYMLLRSKRWYFRVRVPREHLSLVGRRELVRSLGTGDVLLARCVSSAILLKLPELWAKMAATKHDLDSLISSWFEEELDTQFRSLTSGTFGRSSSAASPKTPEAHGESQALIAAHAQSRLEQLSEEFRNGSFDAMRPVARKIAAGLTPPLPENSQAFHVLLKTLMEAQGEVEEARLRWAEGDVAYRPSLVSHTPATMVAPVTVAAPVPVSPPTGGRTLGDAVQLYLDLQRGAGAKPRSVSQKAAELSILLDAFGQDKPTADITKKDAGKVMEALRFLPPRWREKPALKGLAFLEASEEARRLGLKALNPRTVNGHAQTFRGLCGQEVDAGHLTSNPFDRLEVAVRAAGESDRAFDQTEMSQMFSKPLFTGAQSHSRPHTAGNFLIADWRFWAPLIALLSGARVSEIAQLAPEDVCQREGVWCFAFREGEGRTVKTAASVRHTPIHDELIRLGILKLAEEQQKLKRARLLPEIPAPVGGDSGKQLSKWMSEKFLPHLKLRKRPGLGFHSFRHSMMTELRSAGVDQDTGDVIQGRSSSKVGASYGHFPKTALKASLDRMKVPEEIAKIPPRY